MYIFQSIHLFLTYIFQVIINFCWGLLWHMCWCRLFINFTPFLLLIYNIKARCNATVSFSLYESCNNHKRVNKYGVHKTLFYHIFLYMPDKRSFINICNCLHNFKWLLQLWCKISCWYQEKLLWLNCIELWKDLMLLHN